MKRKKLLSVFVLMLAIIPVAKAQKSLNLPIRSGTIKGDFSIEFVDKKVMNKNIILKPNQPFSIQDLGIEACTATAYHRHRDDESFKTYSHLASTKYNTNKYHFYRIKIYRGDNAKPYYGVISFSNGTKSKASQPECQSYQITIPESTFKNATNSAVGYSYEYINYGSQRMGGAIWAFFYLMPITVPLHLLIPNGQIQPTWLIYLSDSETPFINSGFKFSN